MMGMKKRMKRGGKAMKKRVKKKFGGMTDRQRAESQQPGRKKKQISKTAKGSNLTGKATFSKAVKNAVRSKDGKIVRSKSGKAITFGGANKGGMKSREGRMGGGMMKKRMKRGGKAK